MRYLKPLRIVISLLVGSALTAVFLDVFHLLPPGFVIVVLGTQFTPALLTMIATGTIVLAAFLIFLSALMFGRLYCSLLCPLGLLQDFFSHIPVWLDRKKKRRFRYSRPWFAVHYSVLVIVILFAVAGTFIPLNFLEPYSVYGRLVSTLGVPVLIFLNNIAESLLSGAGVIFLSSITYRHFNLGVLLFAVIFLIFIAILAYKKGRLFCNFLCPVGALLGLVSRFSFYKISIVPTSCKECGVCEKVCKAQCIESNSMKIDFAACVGCFNCIDVCPTAGITFVRKGKMKEEPKVSLPVKSRRSFLQSTFVVPFLAKISSLQGGEVQQTKSRYYEARTLPISPPGSRSLRHFSRHCTACYACVEQCPTNVLTPATFQYGIEGAFQPRMDYSVSYCNYDCVLCSEVCPTGAIRPITLEQKHEIQIGVAEFIEDDCIVKVNGTDCGACSEHCPTKAVRMVPYGELFIPEMHPQYCIGCGACEHACPAEPRKAIYVLGHEVHKKAEKPVQNAQQEEQPLNDFPF